MTFAVTTCLCCSNTTTIIRMQSIVYKKYCARASTCLAKVSALLPSMRSAFHVVVCLLIHCFSSAGALCSAQFKYFVPSIWNLMDSSGTHNSTQHIQGAVWTIGRCLTRDLEVDQHPMHLEPFLPTSSYTVGVTAHDIPDGIKT